MFQSLSPPSRIISRGDHVPGFLAGGVRDRQSTDPRTSRQCGGAQRGRRVREGRRGTGYRSTNSGTASMEPGTRVRNVSRTGRHSSPVTPVCSFRLCHRSFPPSLDPKHSAAFALRVVSEKTKVFVFCERPRRDSRIQNANQLVPSRTLLSELGCSRPEQPAPAEYTPAWQDNPE